MAIDKLPLLVGFLIALGTEAPQCPSPENDVSRLLAHSIAESHEAVLLFNGQEELLFSTVEHVYSQPVNVSVYRFESVWENARSLAAAEVLVLWRPSEGQLSALLQHRLLDVQRVVLVVDSEFPTTGEMVRGSLARRVVEVRVETLTGCASITQHPLGHIELRVEQYGFEPYYLYGRVNGSLTLRQPLSKRLLGDVNGGFFPPLANLALRMACDDRVSMQLHSDNWGWGRRDVNGTWSGVVLPVQSGVARMAIYPLLPNSDHLEDFQFIGSPFRLRLDLVAYCNESEGIGDARESEQFAGVGDWINWSAVGLLSVSTLAVALGLLVVNREDISIGRMAGSMAAAYGAALGQCEIQPRRRRAASMALIIAWLLTVGFACDMLRARLLPRLLVKRRCQPYDVSPQELFDAGYVANAQRGRTIYKAFAARADRALLRLADRYNDDPDFEEIRATQQSGGSTSATLLKLVIGQGNRPGTRVAFTQSPGATRTIRHRIGRCGLQIAVRGVTDRPVVYAALRHADPLGKRLAFQLARLEQFGIVEALFRRATIVVDYNKWASSKFERQCERQTGGGQFAQQRPLALRPLRMFVFAPLLAGLGLAALAFAVEVLVAIVRGGGNNSDDRGGSVALRSAAKNDWPPTCPHCGQNMPA